MSLRSHVRYSFKTGEYDIDISRPLPINPEGRLWWQTAQLGSNLYLH